MSQTKLSFVSNEEFFSVSKLKGLIYNVVSFQCEYLMFWDSLTGDLFFSYYL